MSVMEDKVATYYELDVKEQASLLAAILEEANTDQRAFAEKIHHIPLDRASDLDVYYKALSADPARWAHFFLSEFNRILACAKKSRRPFRILKHLDEILWFDVDDARYRDQVIAALRQELNNSNPAFRYMALHVLSNYISDDDADTRQLLRQHLLDPDWRIRCMTYNCLEEMGELTDADRLSTMDRVRAGLLPIERFK
jgi:hypothetical protein